MRRSRFADGDQWRGFGEAVSLGQFPAEFALDGFDGRRRRGSAGGEQPYALGRFGPDLLGRVCDADEHRGRRAEHGDPFVPDQPQDASRFDLPQADMSHAAGGVDPGEGPAVDVEHRQCPQIPVAGLQVMVSQDAHHVHVGIAVGEHHALGARGGTARIVDGEQVVLVDLGFDEVGSMRSEKRLVVEPPVARTFQRHEVLDAGQIVTDTVDGPDVIGVGAHDPGAAVVDDVLEFFRLQAEIYRHQHGPDLRNRVEGLKLRVGIGRYIGDSIALLNAQALKPRGPSIAAREELRVGEPQVAVNDGFTIPIEPPRAACELDRTQGCFHGERLPPIESRSPLPVSSRIIHYRSSSRMALSLVSRSTSLCSSRNGLTSRTM